MTAPRSRPSRRGTTPAHFLAAGGRTDPRLDYLQRASARVDRALEALLPKEDLDPANIHRSMRYSVFAGGKRFRPALCLAAHQAAGGRSPSVVRLGAAIELIHTYSLIHDDLPCMDDDDLRRGRPSNHVLFGEATALLAGSALLVLAMREVGELGKRAGVPRDAPAGLVSLLSRAIGSTGMIGGQIADVAAEGTRPTLPVVRSIHERKTGALIRASAQAGAILAGANERTVRAIGLFGTRLGLAFQIVDDCLDLLSSEGDMGKPVGRDAELGKVTYPGAIGLDGSRREAERLVKGALAAVRDLPARAAPLRGLADLVVDRVRERPATGEA